MVSLLFLSGCDRASTHESSPTPESGNIVNGSNTHVIQMPGGYRNVAFTCYQGNGIYVTSDSVDSSVPSGVAVVAHDPLCNAA